MGSQLRRRAGVLLGAHQALVPKSLGALGNHMVAGGSAVLRGLAPTPRHIVRQELARQVGAGNPRHSKGRATPVQEIGRGRLRLMGAGFHGFRERPGEVVKRRA